MEAMEKRLREVPTTDPGERFQRALWDAGQSVRAALDITKQSDAPEMVEAEEALKGIRDQIDDVAAPEPRNAVMFTDEEAVATLAALELCWNHPSLSKVRWMPLAYKKIYNAYCCVGPAGRPGPEGMPRELR